MSTVGKIETASKTPVFDPTPPLPPFIDSLENLPELYKNPCDRLTRFWWGCDRETFFSYSPTLNRAFIQGHRQKDYGWGGDFAHLEVNPSGTKSVPESLVNSDFSEDIPALGGVLFRGDSKGEALAVGGLGGQNQELSCIENNFSNTLLVCRLSFTKIRLLKFKTVLRILIIFLGINSNISAQSLDVYCLSTVGKIDTILIL